MDLKRATTPPPSAEAERQLLSAPPSTPGAPHDVLPRTMIPPSPGFPVSQTLVATPKPSARLRAPPANRTHSQRSGVKKVAPKKAKTKTAVVKIQNAVADDRKATGFMDLPGVSRLLRQEFRPLYMLRQEIGMDLVEVVKYLQTFYSEAPALLECLPTSKDRKIDMPFTGNLTIAVGEKIKDVEKSAEGVDVWPLLDLWANSYKIEAGFGRYMQVEYNATGDGEAKDLYRLFGRRVQPDRRCSTMNTTWRTILRARSLASVKIHRRPASHSLTFPSMSTRLLALTAPGPRPWIHIFFRREAAEAWMTEEVPVIPDGWLRARGFSSMEHFDVKQAQEHARLLCPHGRLDAAVREQDEHAKEHLAREEIAREEIAREEIAREEIAREEIAREEIAREEVPRDEVPRDEVPRDEVPQDEVPQDEVPQDEGLIINGELHPPKSPYRHPLGRGSQDSELNAADNGEESLFYAYALKSDYANSPPYLLTFATSDVCAQWWSLVQRSYPESTRPGAQLFVLKTDDMQAIQDDPRFFELRSKWFFTSQDRSNCATPVIPLQGTTGHLVARAPLPQAQPAAEKPASTAVDSLAEKLERLSSVVESSAEHIHALSVAQSAGLQRMQEINESNSTQIKALAESQAKLQALIDQNASHYIALSNTSFESHEQVKHAQLAQTCKAMVRTIETLSTSSTPPPRIRGVWYEYDNNAAPTVHGAPRKLAPAPVLSTPPKTPTTPRTPRKLNQK
ncbi:hypothetical protein ST47_g3893 [Ascochyta rabiei]|uniref:Uncharacterized protein n=1 Tax=Didymella rabiei TaxID=5454 RepID=A0A163GQ17_DIDRA|nr:hypothetical protein ST47_g3893 [Ascochyta rabiei]